MSSGPSRFRVQNFLTGCVIDLRDHSTRIRYNTTLEFMLPIVAEALSWPVSHVQLIVGQTVVARAHDIRQRTETFMSNLECTDGVLIIQAVKLPRPDTFIVCDDGYAPCDTCLCDFGGCCLFCANGCAGSGSNSRCRNGDCRHACCASHNPPVEDWCRLCTRT